MPGRTYRPGNAAARLLALGRHGEHATVTLAEHGRVIHLLRMGRRTGEDTRGGGAGDVRGAVAARPELGRDVDHLVVAHLLVVERRPPPCVPAPVLPRER